MEHRATYKVYYEDTDCLGVVYHANYLKYLECGRTEFGGARGKHIRESSGAFATLMCRPVRSAGAKPEPPAKTRPQVDHHGADDVDRQANRQRRIQWPLRADQRRDDRQRGERG